MGTLTIPDTDLCILLGNILDNAIEASEQVTDEKGYIDLELNDSNEILSIHCSNNYHIEPIMQNGKLVTTKTSRILHGIGMQNIADMVKKYDGSMEYQYSDQVFSIDVLLKY
jgi:sensor histidine kinase regulating citrate/malate metabolism